jgi:hypothetical protein
MNYSTSINELVRYIAIGSAQGSIINHQEVALLSVSASSIVRRSSVRNTPLLIGLGFGIWDLGSWLNSAKLINSQPCD